MDYNFLKMKSILFKFRTPQSRFSQAVWQWSLRSAERTGSLFLCWTCRHAWSARSVPENRTARWWKSRHRRQPREISCWKNPAKSELDHIPMKPESAWFRRWRSGTEQLLSARKVWARRDVRILSDWSRRFQIAFPWKPILQRRSIFIHHSNILDLQSDFFMLFYSCWQNMMQCCIILTVNLLTWRKVSPVFYWKTEPFISTHDNFPS